MDKIIGIAVLALLFVIVAVALIAYDRRQRRTRGWINSKGAGVIEADGDAESGIACGEVEGHIIGAEL